MATNFVKKEVAETTEKLVTVFSGPAKSALSLGEKLGGLKKQETRMLLEGSAKVYDKTIGGFCQQNFDNNPRNQGKVAPSAQRKLSL